MRVFQPLDHGNEALHAWKHDMLELWVIFALCKHLAHCELLWCDPGAFQEGNKPHGDILITQHFECVQNLLLVSVPVASQEDHVQDVHPPAQKGYISDAVLCHVLGMT